MKNMLMLALGLVLAFPAHAVDTSKATLKQEFVLKTRNRNLTDFFSKKNMKKIICFYAGGQREFANIVTSVTAETKRVKASLCTLRLYKINSDFDYKGNMRMVRDTIMRDSVLDTKKQSHCTEIRERLSWMAQFIKERPPSINGMFQGSTTDESICLGWVKDDNGTTFQMLFYCMYLDEESRYVWYLWARPNTETVGIRFRYYVSYH